MFHGDACSEARGKAARKPAESVPERLPFGGVGVGRAPIPTPRSLSSDPEPANVEAPIAALAHHVFPAPQTP